MAVYDWEKTTNFAPAISVGAIPDNMLGGDGVNRGYRDVKQGRVGEPRRHSIVGEPFETTHPYHRDHPGLESFVDVFEEPDQVRIGYMHTDPAHRGKGNASALMKHVYDTYHPKRIVWGDRMHDASEKMYDEYRKSMPERTAVRAPDLAQNWVYFRHKDWDDGRLISGAQPHHILVHKVHDGELDGEPIIGQLSNTWAAGNGLAKGHEHDVARGTYDKKGRPQIWESNIDRNHVYDKALERYEYAAPRTSNTPQPRDAQHEARGYGETSEEMYAKLQGQGWDVISMGPKAGRWSVTIQNQQGSKVERQGNTQEQALASALTWAWQHSHMSKEQMDLPINPEKKTLGQVFASLRPSESDGRHLGIKAHASGYTLSELETFLELQEADGTPRGWKQFKDAAITAYSSRGWQAEAGFQLVLWNGETKQKMTKPVQSVQEGQAIAEQALNVPDSKVFRAQVVDDFYDTIKWDSDNDWHKVEDKPNQPEQGQVMTRPNTPAPVESDWAFVSSEETKPDFTFVYYQGTLEIEDWSANSRPADMLKRILDIGGKDITDQNVDDNNMASGDVYKRDGEIDVELTNLSDEDVQGRALDSVHEWAKGMNLIGPIQPRSDG